MILAIGSVVIVALLLILHEHEKESAQANANAASEADASVWAVVDQTTEAPSGLSAQDSPQVLNGSGQS